MPEHATTAHTEQHLGPQCVRKLAWPSWALATCAALFAAGHCYAIYTDSINWDEFAVFHRTEETIRTHVLLSGGRPGLGTLLTMPLVRGCRDIISVAHQARWFTTLATLALYVGLYTLLKRLFTGLRANPGLDAAFGVGLLACVPIVVRWSVQARTDQWSLAFTIWAGVALLASQRTPHRAWLAGAGLGIGYLFSQKAIYAGALMCLLAAGNHFLRAELDLKRELRRVMYTVVSCAAVIAAFRVLVGIAFQPPPPVPPNHWDDYAFYQAVAGHRVYLGIALTLGPHIVLALLTLVASLRRPLTSPWRQLVLTYAVLALGLAVGAFHPSAFAYFWMTLGLFPAVAGALALDAIRQLFSSARVWNTVHVALWAVLLVQAIPTFLALRHDPQRIQRDALAFVERTFPHAERGFHPEGALACRPDPTPFPIYFSSDIANRFRDKAAVSAFIDAFAKKPVVFMLASHRLLQFPAAIQAFWNQHYVLYGPGVLIPGFVAGKHAPIASTITVIVPGSYRWRGRVKKARAQVDGQELHDGDVVSLSAGTHNLRRLSEGDTGTLILDVEPSASPAFEFYSASMVRELDTGI